MKDPHTYIVAFLLLVLVLAGLFAYRAMAVDLPVYVDEKSGLAVVSAANLNALVNGYNALLERVRELEARKCI